MVRETRRGLVDLIVMILMIVLLLGLGALAFFAWDGAQKDETYVARLRELPPRQQAEHEATKAKLSELSAYIGFQGESAYSSPDALKSALESGARVVPDYYEFTGGNVDTKGEIKGVTYRTVRVKNAEGDEVDVRIPVVNNTQRNGKQIYEYNSTMTMWRAIGEQDDKINQLVSQHIPKITQQRVNQRKWRDDAAKTGAGEVDSAIKDVKDAISDSDSAVKGSNQEMADAEAQLADSQSKAHDAYKELEGVDVKTKREEAFAKMREIEDSVRNAEKWQDWYRYKADGRREDDGGEPDGTVFLADKVSGWVWIDIGQRQDVRINQVFTVIRADATQPSVRDIGQIRVKEVMKGNICRCRVDALNDANVFPMAGDMVRNADFSDRQYTTFAFVGEFGGKFSTYTEQQLKDMLNRVGLRVMSEVNGATDVIVVGGNWQDDPQFKKVLNENMKVVRMREEDILYFLGYAGPDRVK